MSNLGIPGDAIALVDGQYLKLGRFDKIYRWHDGHWLVSEKSPADVIRLITTPCRYKGVGNKWLAGS